MFSAHLQILEVPSGNTVAVLRTPPSITLTAAVLGARLSSLGTSRPCRQGVNTLCPRPVPHCPQCPPTARSAHAVCTRAACARKPIAPSAAQVCPREGGSQGVSLSETYCPSAYRLHNRSTPRFLKDVETNYRKGILCTCSLPRAFQPRMNCAALLSNVSFTRQRGQGMRLTRGTLPCD